MVQIRGSVSYLYSVETEVDIRHSNAVGNFKEMLAFWFLEIKKRTMSYLTSVDIQYLEFIWPH